MIILYNIQYRDQITRNIHKVWPKLQDDYVADPFQSRFNYYDYGGQYNFIVCYFDNQKKLIVFFF